MENWYKHGKSKQKNRVTMCFMKVNMEQIKKTRYNIIVEVKLKKCIYLVIEFRMVQKEERIWFG